MVKILVNRPTTRIVCSLNAAVRELERTGANEVEIFMGMADHMADFKILLDAGEGTLNDLCARLPSLYNYAKILENIATGIANGDIVVPK